MAAEIEESVDSDNLSLAVTEFASETAGVNETLVVSSDGFVLAATSADGLPGIEQLAAIISGLTSLTNGAAELYQLDKVRQIIVEMRGGYLFVVATGGGCSIGALADPDTNLGDLGYELTLLSQRATKLLTPQLVDTLKNAIGPNS